MLEITRNEVEEFVQSRIWRYLLNEALVQTETAHTELRTMDPGKESTEMARAQGMIRGLEWFVDQPAVLVERIEFERKTEKKKEEEEKKNG
jgi:hypothetical protein